METPTTPPEPSVVRVRSFARNATWLMVAEAVGKIASFAFVVVVARGLGASEYGAFTFAVAFVGPFFALSAWGLDVTLIREVARKPEVFGSMFSSGLALRAGFGLVMLTLALAISPLFVDSSEGMLALAIVGAALLLDELSSYLRATFRSFDRMELHAIVVLTNRVMSVLLALLAFRLGASLIGVMITYLLGSLGAFVLGFLALLRYLPSVTSWRPQRRQMLTMLRKGAPLGVASVINMITFRADTVILQAVEGTIAVANYGIAYRFFESFLFITYNLGDTAMPRVARAGPSKDASRVFVATVALLLTLYLPLAVTYLLSGEWIIVHLFSPRYKAAAGAMVWLGFAAALYGVAYAARISAIALGRRRDITAIAAAALVVNLALNAYAIPRHGIAGAAAVTFITEVVQAALLVMSFRRVAAPLVHLRMVAVPIIGAGAMALAGVSTGRPGPIALGVGAVVYGVVCLAAARVLAPEELRRIVKLLGRVTRRISSRRRALGPKAS